MTAKLRVALIRASLPSYFPDRHNVWQRCETAASSLCDAEGADLLIYPEIPMDGAATSTAVDWCRDQKIDFVLLLHGGFTMGDVARTLARSEFRLGFWSVPEPQRTGDVQLNNFVSLNMSLSISRQVRSLKENPVQWYHGAPESPALQNRLRTTIRALKACKLLMGAKIGAVGGLAMTFYNMEVSSNALFARLGVTTHHHDMHELTERMQNIPASRVAAELALMRDAARIDNVSDAQMTLTASCALAMRDIANENGYAALTVSDWPALQEHPGMHPGAAFSWLEETDQLPVASEGDILGAISQLVSRSFSGRVGYLLDMTEPDLDAGQMLVWHGGGGPLYLADDAGARWINHPMIGRGTEAGPIYGAIADLVFRDGPVSLLRVARDGGALFSMTAEVAGRDPSGFDGCRGWLQNFEIDGQTASLEDVVSTVMAHGLEHHFILMPGNFAAELAEFGSWTAMQRLGYRPMRSHLDSRDFS